MQLYRHKFVSMGCPCEIGLYSDNPKKAQTSIAKAQNEVHRLDQKYSPFKDNSLISLLHIDATQPVGVKVDGETSALLNYAETQFELTKGMFDITAGRLSQLWYHRSELPTQTDIETALQYTGWTKLSWQDNQLSMPVGMQIELGGLVKEYAADRAALILKKNGMNAAYVELGGDIHVTGPQADGSPWNMGIRKPDYRQVENTSS